MSKYLAVLDLDDSVLDNPDQNVNGNSPLGYVEDELGWVEDSGITPDSIECLNENSIWQSYMKYLAEWIFSHSDASHEGESPLSYREWKEKSDADAYANHNSEKLISSDDLLYAMNYPDNGKNDIMVIRVNHGDENGTLHLVGYIDGDGFDISVVEPNYCFLDDFIKDSERSGSLKDFIAHFGARVTPFYGTDEDAPGNAMLYLSNVYVGGNTVCKAERGIILPDEDSLQNLFDLKDGFYLVGIKNYWLH